MYSGCSGLLIQISRFIETVLRVLPLPLTWVPVFLGRKSSGKHDCGVVVFIS